MATVVRNRLQEPMRVPKKLPAIPRIKPVVLDDLPKLPSNEVHARFHLDTIRKIVDECTVLLTDPSRYVPGEEGEIDHFDADGARVLFEHLYRHNFEPWIQYGVDDLFAGGENLGVLLIAEKVLERDAPEYFDANIEKIIELEDYIEGALNVLHTHIQLSNMGVICDELDTMIDRYNNRQLEVNKTANKLARASSIACLQARQSRMDSIVAQYGMVERDLGPHKVFVPRDCEDKFLEIYESVKYAGKRAASIIEKDEEYASPLQVSVGSGSDNEIAEIGTGIEGAGIFLEDWQTHLVGLVTDEEWYTPQAGEIGEDFIVQAYQCAAMVAYSTLSSTDNNPSLKRRVMESRHILRSTLLQMWGVTNPEVSHVIQLQNQIHPEIWDWQVKQSYALNGISDALLLEGEIPVDEN